MAVITERMNIVLVTPDDDDLVAAFLPLGRAYIAEISDWSLEDQRHFVDGIVVALRQPKYRLSLLMRAGEPIGFSVTRSSGNTGDEAGILEFYVAPEHRRSGLGRLLAERAEADLRERGAARIRLKAQETAEGFWRAIGYGWTGECDPRSGQKIFLKVLRADRRTVAIHAE